MEKLEFKKFCQEEFLKRGFIKKKSMYFAQGKDNLLCSLNLQGAYGDCYFINAAFYIDQPVTNGVYPTFCNSDLFARLVVTAKDLDNGKPYLTGVIEYGLYTKEELMPSIAEQLDERIMPILKNGKPELLKRLDFWHTDNFSKELRENIRAKLIQQISGM